MRDFFDRRYWMLVSCVLFIAAAVIGCPPLDDDDDDDDDTPQTVTVPDVVGLSQTDAERNLVWAGLRVGTITPQASDTVDAGDVSSQSPLAGRTVDEGSAVDLVISTGPASTATEETIMLPGNVPLQMVWIEPGTFLMGRYPGEQDSCDAADPQHEVTLTQGFWMGKYELTKWQWTAVMGTTPWSGRGYELDDPNSPAEFVSWNGAQAFITALNSYTGKTFRLPTEAEWEYACRAGTTTRFYWGDDPSYTVGDDYCWWVYNAERVVNEEYAHVVGQKLPNAWGLYDMSGNVFEWCEDDWHDNYIGAPADGSAWVDSPRSDYRVLRGGAWCSDGDAGSDCRSAVRGRWYQSESLTGNGFRVVCVSSR